MNSEKNKAALSPGEFAAIFGKSQTWGYRQLYSGKVKAVTGYGRILIPASEVDRLLSEAGRYLGKDRPTETHRSEPSAKRTRPERPNPWRKAVESRRKNGGEAGRAKNAARASRRVSSERASALRKLNRK